MTEIQGTCAEGSAPVRDAFTGSFDRGDERGACVVVTVDGEPVVDLWAGLATDDDQPWARDTIVNIYSTTKTMAALRVLMLADRGEVDLGAPTATYWRWPNRWARTCTSACRRRRTIASPTWCHLLISARRS